MYIAAELLKLVERAVLDRKKESKPRLREGDIFFCFFVVEIVLDRYIL